MQLAIAANGGGPRTGTVTAGGRTFTVNQQGNCSFTLSTAAVTIPAAGSASSVDVAGDASCSWTAVPQQDWIAITSGASGMGNGTVQFTVAPNAGPARTGQIVIGDRTLAINQTDGCAFAIAPQQQDGAGRRRDEVGVVKRAIRIRHRDAGDHPGERNQRDDENGHDDRQNP